MRLHLIKMSNQAAEERMTEDAVRRCKTLQDAARRCKTL